MPKFCEHCGGLLSEGKKFCSGCGSPVAPAQQAPAPTPRPVAPVPRRGIKPWVAGTIVGVVVTVVVIIIVAAFLLGGRTSTPAVAEPKPQLKAELIDCNYQYFTNTPQDSRFWFFFKITNIGDTSTRLPAQVWIVPAGQSSRYGYPLSQIYGKNEILWGEEQWSSGDKGQEWYVDNINPRKDFNFGLYYCENCQTPENGLLIYSGSTYGCKTAS